MYFFKKNSNTHLPKKGFTLIEVLVSLSIFTVVATISVSALLTLIEANSRAQNSQSIMVNLSFMLDSMTREIRTGSYFYCGDDITIPTSGTDSADCVNGGEALGFREGGTSLTKNSGGDSRWIAFRLNGGVIERRLGNGDGDGDDDEDDDWVAVTSSNIIVDELRFYVTGTTRRDGESPSATVYISGTTGDDASTQGFFDIQTTVVQQLIDI